MSHRIRRSFLSRISTSATLMILRDRISRMASQIYPCETPFQTHLNLSVFASDDVGVARMRRELRVRSDGCRPPQPSEVSDLIGRWPLPSYRGSKTQVICTRIVLF